MPVIFNSITQFIESVGRRTVQSKRNSLDQMTCVFTGPNAMALGFLPFNGTPHPQYPLMLCENAEITNRGALVAEVRVSYVGKLKGAPTGVYLTVPDIVRSRHLGSISYTTSYSNSPIQIATASYTVRYTAKAVTFRYLTNQPPVADFAGNFVAQAQPYLGVENAKKFISALSFSTGSPDSGYLQTVLIMENDLTDVTINDLDNGWYEISEVYLTQPFLNTSIVGLPGQTFTSTSVLESSPPPGP